MGPVFDILFCWQAVLVALACSGITHLIKTVVDVVWGKALNKRASLPPGVDPKTAAELGKTVRQSKVIVNRLVFPMVPIVVGMVFAVVVPLWPEALSAYVKDHVTDAAGHWWQVAAVRASWGAACGQFSDYIFSKTHDAFRDWIANKTAQRAAD